MRSFVLFFIFCLIGTAGFSQAAKPLLPDSALGFLNRNYPQEKVFLQTDRTQYIAGESVWMKAWCVLENEPTFLSRIVYVDLVNTAGKVVQKKMYKLDSLSSTPADFIIPEEVGTGNYSINAYTMWMLNFPEYLFKKDIFVYSKDYKTRSGKTELPVIKVQFLPEGGNMVAGIANRVAFKAIDNSGFPVDIKGSVQDNTGKTVADFASTHDGMGTVEFTPEAGKSYTASVPGAGGSSLSFKLPEAQDEGITLRIENSNPNRFTVLLNRTEKNKEKYAKLIVVAQMNQQLVVKATLNLDEGQMALPVNKKNLLPGIIHVTVFNEQYEPLAERIAFIENYQLLKPVVKFDKQGSTARAVNQYSFDLVSKNPASLSCLVSSVVDTALYKESNIASSLLMTSELQGYVHNPGYYFSNKNPSTLKDLDILMMTQGWRRFAWKKILNNEFAKLNYPVESAISFGGVVTKSDRTEVVKDGKVSFIIKGSDSTSMLAEATITDKGEFLLKDVNFMKDAKVAYMGTNNKAATYIVDVKMKPTYIDSLTTSPRRPTINLDTMDINGRNSLLARYLYGSVKRIDTSAGSGYLGNVTVTSKKVSKEDSLNQAYAEGPFKMGKAIDPKDFKFTRTIWSIIQQAVPGVSVEGNPFDPDVKFTRFSGLGGTDATASAGTDEMSPQGLRETSGIAYFLNEVNVDKDVINTLLPEDVALIKVLKTEGAALGATQGAIAIYTHKGFTGRKAPYEKTYTVEKKLGYSVAREFYRPDYGFDPSARTGTDSDVTLYWNAHIKPARDGKYRFRFFNNDIGQQFKLVIQGLDKEGNLIYFEQLIK